MPCKIVDVLAILKMARRVYVKSLVEGDVCITERREWEG